MAFYITPLQPVEPHPLEPMVERLTDANLRLRWLCAVCAAVGLVVGLGIGLLL